MFFEESDGARHFWIAVGESKVPEVSVPSTVFVASREGSIFPQGQYCRN